jgi:hypothetical protein
MRRAVGTTLAGILGWGALLWIMGLDVVHALALATAVTTLIGLRRSPAVNADEGWPSIADTRSDSGVRREVARLSWSMQGYESRVQRQSVHRLHEIAAFRLGEQGLDLEDPRDYLGCKSALGDRAYRVVSEPDERPLYADFVAAVGAVEKIGSTQIGSTQSRAKGGIR